ncbi:MAG: D-alanyl-D-alanine carboxypeptidase family protein [Blastocatellia bacterium]
MSYKTYPGRTYIIENNEARIRRDDDMTVSATWSSQERLPPGRRVGDFKVIPKRTEVLVTETKADAARTVFVRVKPARPSMIIPSGWTKASNLAGGFLNELVGLSPDSWVAEPGNINFTVTHPQARLRGGPPDFSPQGPLISQGQFAVVTQWSADRRFAFIWRGVLSNGRVQAKTEIGWTSASNLTPGWSNAFVLPEWLSEQGPYACWEGGNYIGPKILVNIVGFGSQLEQLTLDAVDPWQQLLDAAMRKNIRLSIESGFRTWAAQAQLFEAFQNGQGNLAARPGSSNHQNGRALDMNTTRGDGDPIYEFLKANAPKLGFIRTVNGEPWHWEYRPEEAAALVREGRFALASVRQ